MFAAVARRVVDDLWRNREDQRSCESAAYLNLSQSSSLKDSLIDFDCFRSRTACVVEGIRQCVRVGYIKRS